MYGHRNNWVVCPKPNPTARQRLLCFHYAGGSASLFTTWSPFLLDDVELWAVQLPGRGERFREEPYTHMAPLIARFIDSMEGYLDLPLSLFGYSMGALVAFEVAREVYRRELCELVHLFVAARRAPQVPPPEHRLSTMSDENLITYLQNSGNGAIQRLASQKTITKMYLSIIRADCHVAEQYQYSQWKPLDCPITAFGGRDDPYVGRDHLDAWRIQTSGRFYLQQFNGGHFFLKDNRPALLDKINQCLQNASDVDRNFKIEVNLVAK